MGDLNHARMLILMARKDLEALTGMVGGEPFADEVFGLHAQQAIEKALKSWLALLGIEYPRTHNIAVLLSSLEDHGVDVENLRTLDQYNSFAVQYRYEIFSITEGVLDREDAVEHVTDLVEKVERLIQKAGS